MTTAETISEWHRIVAQGDVAALQQLLAEDCLFLSPVVHTPQEGRDVSAMYLAAAFQVFGDNGLTYVHELVGDGRAVLEFTADLDGTLVNGVDIIDVGDDGLITQFKVMVRPLQGVNELHRRMGEMLAAAEERGPQAAPSA